MTIQKTASLLTLLPLAAVLFVLTACPDSDQPNVDDTEPVYEYEETRNLVSLVNDAAEKVNTRGKEAFSDFREPGSRWRHQETYIFVIDPEGNMLVHIDPGMEETYQLDLEDVNGKSIVRGLIDTAMAHPDKPEGWYHYEWPVPDGIVPRWKSSYVKLVKGPDGNQYVVGSGMYNDRMERAFVVDIVKDAVLRVEIDGSDAFPLFYDPAGHFRVKDTYIFIFDKEGYELVNPAFPNLEGRNLLDVRDTQGKPVVRDMLEIARTRDAGWIDYMWPKPGQSVSTQKSAYVSKAMIDDDWVLVGSGVYLEDAPRVAVHPDKMTAPELMKLVREAAEVFEAKGEEAYPEFRQKGSKWFHNDTYFFVWNMEGIRVFHAAHPEGEGLDVSGMKDITGRPWGRMFLETAHSPSGEGWVHYMYPEPGDIFPTWKSSFLKRVIFPSGEQKLIGCGIYNMQMDRAFIEDVVNNAATLVAEEGVNAFEQLRDKTGPFVFMDIYVFVMTPDGTELVNPVQPSLEGQNLMGFRDLEGKEVIKEQNQAAMEHGSGWLEHYWYKPGENIPALKKTLVRKVEHGEDIFIVGSGYYPAK